jgi:hypothetical protein
VSQAPLGGWPLELRITRAPAMHQELGGALLAAVITLRARRVGAATMALDPERYVVGDDGLLVEKVGPWAKDKLEVVGDYIQISGATRRKYRQNRPAFIDVFCGPGRSLVRSTGEYIDGSPVTAFKQGSAPVAQRFPLPDTSAWLRDQCWRDDGHDQRQHDVAEIVAACSSRYRDKHG